MASKLKIINRFGIAPNDLLNREDLSLKAKGLYVYIQSKPDGWNFSVEKIALQTSDGVESITTAIKELESMRYLKRQKYQDEKGFWGIEYILSENPIQENPRQDFPIKGNLPNNSKKEFSKKDISNKDTISFEIFWEKYPNKTNKKKSRYLWESKKLDSKLDLILEFIEKAKNTDRWKKGFIKAPDVFLRNESWEDDLTAYGGANVNNVYKNKNSNLLQKIKEKHNLK